MLEICRASAGSGKTHRLTQKYLEMLFSSGRFDKYRSILAVTFTNKATAEMKRRIIEELFKLSDMPTNSPFYKELVANGEIVAIARKCGEEAGNYIPKAAGRYLTAILNDYSAFGVSTIDRFLQQIMRAFARELGQYPTYNVGLDNDAVLQFAIDNLMDSLGDRANDTLLKWLIELAIERIRREEKWNMLPGLQALGSEIFTENYKIEAAKTDGGNISMETVRAYKKELMDEVNKYRSEMSILRDKTLNILRNHGLTTDKFKGGSKSFMTYIDKLQGDLKQIPPYSDTFKNTVNGDVDGWYSKNSNDKPAITAAYNDGLRDVLRKIANDDKLKQYCNNLAILRNIAKTGVIGHILQEIRRHCRDKNILLLSETTNFLSKIIGSSNTPFIYEQVGTRIENYLLDEFQDTSRLQWENFKPLIDESLAKGHSCLVVGDVKQSIYRWRGSDWNLLRNEIAAQFPKQHFDNTLEFNWRSSENVVNFNNDFFSWASREILKEDCDIYSDVEQKLPPKNRRTAGHVKVKFFDCKKDDLFENVKPYIVETMNKLKENGFKAGDIAFLIRKNKEGELVAKLLVSEGYKVVTDDSLNISVSPAVRKIISRLKLFDVPENTIARHICGIPEAGKIDIGPESASLYDVCEEAIRNLDEKEKSEIPFIQAFLDIVTDFIATEGSDIHQFLKWWDENGEKRSLSAPASDEAVRIMTVHKAKGLEFKAVILPFWDLKYTMSRQDADKIFWIPTGKPKEEIQIIPVHCIKKTLERTDFYDNYQQEGRNKKIDCLNLSYVAFTRAIDELIVFARTMSSDRDKGKNGKPEEREYKSDSVANVLHNYLQNLAEFDNDKQEYELGEWTKYESAESAELTESMSDTEQFVSVPIGDRLRFALRGGDFFSNGEDGIDVTNARERGIVLHEILSKVSTESDLPQAVKDGIAEGSLSQAESEEILELLEKMLNSVSERHWFDETYKLLNEVNILTPDGYMLRPDRIMIKDNEAVVVDYKFGKRQNAAHKTQVQEYMTLLSDMGYRNVTGFLWYSDGGPVKIL